MKTLVFTTALLSLAACGQLGDDSLGTCVIDHLGMPCVQEITEQTCMDIAAEVPIDGTGGAVWTFPPSECGRVIAQLCNGREPQSPGCIAREESIDTAVAVP